MEPHVRGSSLKGCHGVKNHPIFDAAGARQSKEKHIRERL